MEPRVPGFVRRLATHLPDDRTTDERLRGQVELERPIPGVARHRVDRSVAEPAPAPARHREQSIDAPEPRHALLDGALDGSFIGKVRGVPGGHVGPTAPPDGDCRPATRPGIREFARVRARARNDEQVRAFVRHPPGGRGRDARGSGDHADPARKSVHATDSSRSRVAAAASVTRIRMTPVRSAPAIAAALDSPAATATTRGTRRS